MIRSHLIVVGAVAVLALVLLPALLPAQGQGGGQGKGQGAIVCGMDLRLGKTLTVSLEPLVLVKGRPEPRRKGDFRDAHGAGEYAVLAGKKGGAEAGRLIIEGEASVGIKTKALSVELSLPLVSGLRKGQTLLVSASTIRGRVTGSWSVFTSGKPLPGGKLTGSSDCHADGGGPVPEK